MIHCKTAASSCAKCTFNSVWQSQKSRVFPLHPHSLPCKKKKKNHCHHAFIPLLSRERPPTPAEITGVAFTALNESCDVEWDGKVEKKSEGIQILDEEPWCSPRSICTPPVSGQVGATITPRWANRQAATPGTATQFGVPSQPACSQSLFFMFVWQHEGLLQSWYSCVEYVFIVLKLWMSAGGCCQGKTELLNYKKPCCDSGASDHATVERPSADHWLS